MGAQEQAALQRQLLAGRRQLRSSLILWVTRWFAAADSFRDADQARFVRDFTPLALGAQRASASMMYAYLDQLIADMTGDRTPPPALDVDTVSGTALRGVDPQVVYARPFAEIWRVLAEHEQAKQEALRDLEVAAVDTGTLVDEPRRRQVEEEFAAEKPLTKAVAAGERRAKLTGITDLELAERETARQVLTTDQRAADMQFYRRVLTGDENCGLCVVAATQRYHREQLLPIHPGCDCVVEPIPEGEGRRQVLDEALLEAAHDAIKTRFGLSDRSARQIDYRKILLVRDHGELGPVLTVAKHRFTDVDDLPDTSDTGSPPPVAELDPGQVDAAEEQRDPEPVPDLATWTDEQLEEGIAQHADDEQLLDSILTELDRRTTEPDANEGQADAEPIVDEEVVDEQDAEKWAKFDELVASGMSEQDAYAEAFDTDPEQVRRDDAIARLRTDGYRGSRFDDLARAAYRDELQRDYFAAEQATNGFLLGAEGQRQGLDPLDLWRRNEAYVRRWASDELKAWWDEHGRLTFDVFSASLLSGSAESRFRSGGETWLQ